MKKFLLKSIAAVCTTALLLTSLAACNKGTETDQKGSSSQSTTAPASNAASEKPAEPVKLSIYSINFGREHNPENPVVKEIEQRTNTKLDIQLMVSDGFVDKLNVLVASGTMPDIVRVGNFDIFQYVPQGVFIEIGDLINQHGQNLLKYIPQSAWDLSKVEGKIYGIPHFNWPGKYVTNIRQDWLDNLGLQVPTNLEELEAVLKAFTLNDPDKNGKNDTYGYGSTGGGKGIYMGAFMPIFGAFGIQTEYFSEKDGKIYYSQITPEYKEAIAYIKNLYLNKYINQEIFISNTDQARQSIVQSKAGFFNGWWSDAEQTLMGSQKMGEVNPNAKWTMVPPIKGKNGESGLKAMGQVSGTVCVSKSCKEPVAAIKFLDYLASDEGAELAFLGLKDVHYTEKDGVPVRTEAGENAMKEKWLDELSQLIFRVDMTMGVYKHTNPTYWPYITAARDNNMYYNVFEGIVTEKSVGLKAQLKDFEEEWFINFVTGQEPLEKFDEYVKQWKAKGGQEYMDELITAANKIRAKNYVAGH